MPKSVIDVSIIWLNEDIYSRNTWFPTTDVQTQNIGKLRYMPTVALPTECRHTVATQATEYQRWRDVGCRSRRCRPMPTLGQRRNASWVRDVISWINYSIMLLSLCIRQRWLYTLRLGQNGCHFADNILKFIFLNMEIVVFWLKFYWKLFSRVHLNHWCWVTHICVSKLISIGSASGLSPCWRQTIIRTNAGILLIGPLETNFSEILIEIYTFSFNKMHLKMLSVKWWQFCLCLYVLMVSQHWFKLWDQGCYLLWSQ